MQPSTTDQVAYLTGPQVQRRYNITYVTLWRWMKDPAMGFPKPLKISNRRNLFLLSELEAFERSRVSASMGAAA